MSEIAHDALRKLLTKCESARRNDTERATTLVMSESSYPAYLNITTFEEKQAAHSIFADAQRRGAITIEWDKRAGDRGHVQRLKLVDGDVLAAYLGEIPYWDLLNAAQQSLERHLAQRPQLERFIAAWRHGRSVRGLGPQDVADVLDGLRVLEYLRTAEERDRPLRALSVKLFGDSKRLEALVGVLDVLTSSDTLPSHGDEVFAQLGLFRAVMPMLLAGDVNIGTSNGGVVRTIEPYVGLPPESILGVATRGDDIDFILTVENLSPFYDIARAYAGRIRGLVLYTGGMPSPAWREAYARILRCVPRTCTIYHWGDIDAGGFRIAESISAVVASAGRTLMPHLMNPSQLSGSHARTASNGIIREMRKRAAALGWAQIAEALHVCPLIIEQEAIEPSLPVP